MTRRFQGFPLPRNDTFVGHIDECPPALRAKLLSEARAVDLPAVAYRGFMPRLKVLLLGLGQPALRDLVEKYGPPHLELRQGAPVVTMSQILMGPCVRLAGPWLRTPELMLEGGRERS